MKVNLIFIPMRFILLLLFFFCTHTFAQQNTNQAPLLTRGYELVDSNPEESLKIGEHLLKNATTDAKKASASFLIAESHKVKSDYNKALIYAFETDKYSKKSEAVFQINVLLFKSQILRYLLLDNQSGKYLNKAEILNSKIISDDIKNYITVKILLEKTILNLDRQKVPEALVFINSIDENFKKTVKEYPEVQQKVNIVKGKVLSGLSINDSASQYFEKALLFYEDKKNLNFLEESLVLMELSKIYFQYKDHDKAIDYLLKSLKNAQKLNNIIILKEINRQLSINYLALNNKDQYQYYNTNFLVLSNNTENIETESINSAYNLITQEQETHFETEQNIISTFFYIVLSISILVLLTTTLLFFRNKSRKKRFKEIIKYLETNSNNNTPKTYPEKEINKNLIISAGTEQNILTKLKRFEASTKYTNKEMSLALLASQLETNTKYLSEIINKHYNDNFNTYINKLRINYIIEKLKTDSHYLNYKISYLANESGFSSHSSFATVFKSITGIAPTTFIYFLKDELKKEEE